MKFEKVILKGKVVLKNSNTVASLKRPAA